MAPKDQFTEKNEHFIARREIMFQAIHDYHAESHVGQTEEQKIDALVGNVDKAAARSERGISDLEKAKIALEWETSIRENDSQTHTTKDTLKFVDDVKGLTSGSMPHLPRDADYGVDFSTLKIDELSPLEKIKLAMNVQERAKVSAVDLQNLAAINKGFEEAAEKNHLIHYSQNEDLTKLFDAKNLSFDAVAKKSSQLQSLKAGPQSENPDKGQEEEKEEGIGGFLSKMLGGFGEFLAMILTVLSGLFAGSGMRGGHDARTTRQEVVNKAIDDTATNLKGLVDEKGQYSEAKVDKNKDGIIDMSEIGAVMGGQNPDINKDGKLHSEEKKIAIGNLDHVIKKHPEIHDIAAGFRKSLEGLNIDGHTNVSLPGAGKTATEAKEGGR